MKHLFIYVLGIALLVNGCYSTEVAESGDVNQDEIFQKYYAEYNAEDGTSYATAIFRFGGHKGTTLELSDGSNIEVNGEETYGEKEFLRGMVYRFDNLLTKSSAYNFVFTTTEKKQLKNTIALSSLTPIAPKDPIKNHQEAEIAWNGQPVDVNESVEVTITDRNGYTYSRLTDMKGSNSIYISSDSLATGIANLRFIRYVNKSLDAPTDAGGSISGAYYSKIIPVTISE